MRRPAVLLALACAGVLATVGLWFAANDLAAGRELDAALGDALYGLAPAAAAEPLKGVSSLADELPFAVGAVGLAALAWLRGGRRLALFASLVLLLANLVTQLLQPVLADHRRVDFGGTSLTEIGSWPSGHATAAMLLALGAIVVAGPRLRPAAIIAGLAYALGVGGSLVALGGHLPGDVLAGYLVAGAFTAAGAAAYAASRGRATPADRRRAQPRPRSGATAPALGALAAAAVLATGVGKAVLTRRDELATALDRVPLVLAAAGTLTLAVALAAGATLALRR